MNHPKIAELLPWYVNGSLDIGDRQAAALETASCDECSTDVDALTKIQAAMLELEAAAPEPSEAALGRALAAIEEEDRKRRLGHPWFGWWWALSPFGRAIAISAGIALVIVGTGELLPKPTAPASNAVAYNAPMRVTLEPQAVTDQSVSAGQLAAPAVLAKSAAAPAATAPPLAASAQIARTGSFSLLVPDVERAIADVTSIARAESGVVLSLGDSTPARAGDRHTASLQLAVPADRFDATISALSRLGGVQSRGVNAESLQFQIVDSEARLRNLRRAETDLLKIMDRAGKIDDVLAVENQVTSTREQIEELDGEASALHHRVAYSTISIDLADEASVASVDVGIGTQLANTWRAAIASVRTFTIWLAGGLLWGVAYLPYVIGVALIVGFAALRFRRAG